MPQTQQEDAWLSSVMPSSWSASQQHHSCKPLELHKRLVHLASLREAALQRLGQLDAVKVSLTERKATQQGRLAEALEARLAAAHAAVEPHRCATWGLVKALEKEAAVYSDILKGLQPQPPSEQWASFDQRYQQLQERVQQQDEAVQPGQLEMTLSSGLQPCQVDHVQVVEQLQTEVDSLKQQLQHAHTQQLARTQAPQLALASKQEEPLQHHQEVHCVQELVAMQQLTDLVLQQLQLYQNMQQEQQQRLPSSNPAELALLQKQVQQQQLHGHVGRAACDMQLQSQSQGSSRLHLECQRLKQQLQQVSEAADALLQGAAAEGGCSACHVHSDQLKASNCFGIEQQPAELHDPLGFNNAEFPGPYDVYGSAMQKLRHAMQGPAGGASLQHGLHNMDLRLHNGMHQNGSGSSRGSNSETQQQLRVAKLRMAYQQMLHNVQARYQENLRQLEVRHSEALRAQAHSQQQALADLTKQHQEVCARLAAAATNEADLQLQLTRLSADKQALQQQVDKLQREVGSAAASALAVVQVQHEQQMLALRQEQQQTLQEARQQLEQMQQQLRELQQQQADALPSAQTVAALVAEATSKQAAQHQQEVAQLESRYQAALQQREQQHTSLLHELAELRQLQDEPSNVSSISAADIAPPAVLAGGTPDMPGSLTNPNGSKLHVQGTGQSCDAAEREQPGLSAERKQQQQTKQQQEGDAMGALIAAVLGSGPIGQAQQRLHRQRLAVQQQQQQQEAEEHQRCRQLQQQPAGRSSSDLQDQLDKLLGLGPQQHSSQQQGVGLGASDDTGTNSASLAPANAALAAAMERAKVAESCLAALQDISCSSTCNATLGPWAPGVGGTAGTTISGRPGGKSASPPKGSSQQQWQQWQQHHKAGPGSPTRKRSPSPVRQHGHGQQQQESGMALLRCVRCGEQEGPGIGPCCFHPGLIAAPGPLMYGAEWHTCRAQCTPDKPGCYTRKEHFFSLLSNSSSSNPVGTSAAIAAHKLQQQAMPQFSLATAMGTAPSPQTSGALRSPNSLGSPTRRQTVAAGGRAVKLNVSPPRFFSPPRVSSGRYVGVGAVSSKAAATAGSRSPGRPSREPEPRSTVPKPSVWRG